MNTFKKSIERNNSNDQRKIIKPIKYQNMQIESYIEELKASRDLSITRILYEDQSYDVSLEYRASFNEIASLFKFINNNENCKLGSFSIILEENNDYKLTANLSFTRSVIIE